MREEGGEIAAELRGELVRLQRQYRLLEDDRNTYRNETVLTLQRQRRMIKRLMREEKELMKDVNMVTQKRNVIADNKTMKELQCMLKAEDEVKSAIEDENSKICTSQVDLKNHERKVEVCVICFACIVSLTWHTEMHRQCGASCMLHAKFREKSETRLQAFLGKLTFMRCSTVNFLILPCFLLRVLQDCQKLF